MNLRTPTGPSQDRAPVPEVEAWMARFGAPVEPASEDGAHPSLAASAVRALATVLSRPGRNRESAFALLAADGLLTSAIESIADEWDDPEVGFRDLLRRVVEDVGEVSQ